MALDTQLSRRPYFDDFDEKAQFYRILYKPGVALQTRELNQTQSIMQDQINKFGRSIYKEGSIVEGCVFSFDNNVHYVKLSDNLTNLSTYNATDYHGQYLYNDISANQTIPPLVAVIVGSANGYISQAPNTNTFYVKYLNSSKYINGNQKTTFDPKESLYIRNSANTLTFAQLSVADNTAPHELVGPVTGLGFSMAVSDGVVFKKGNFLYVKNQSVIVSRYSDKPDGLSVGFEAPETIENAQTNNALYDNAAGSPNYSAPGADRLKITPTLTVRTTNEANKASFFTLVDFKNGAAVTLKQTPQYSTIGAEMARRSFETNGNFVVTPYTATTKAKVEPESKYIVDGIVTHNNLLVSKGLSYVEGYRVEYMNTNYVDLRKATDYRVTKDQIVTTNFGNYFYVNEVSGQFGSSSSIIKVELHNAAKTSVSSNGRLGVSLGDYSEKIGTAFVNGFVFDSGTQGLPDAKYRLYLFNLNTSGFNPENIRSIVYKDPNTGDVLGVADVILSKNLQGVNVAALNENTKNRLFFPFGQNSIKTNGFTDAKFVYRKKHSTTTSFGTTGTLSLTIPQPSGGDVYDQFLYQNGYLNNQQIKDFHVVATSRGQTANVTGTVNSSSSSTIVGGNSTTFLTDYKIGDYISVDVSAGGDGTSMEDRLITSISNNLQLTVNQPFSTSKTTVHAAVAYPIGAPITFNYNNRTALIESYADIESTKVTFDLGTGYQPKALFNAEVYYNVRRKYVGSANPKTKVIQTGSYVKINASTNVGKTLGPWCLGVPDVLAIEAVYIDTTYVSSGTDYSSSFTIDNGQSDAYYGLSYLKLTPGSPASNKITSSSRITVKLKYYKLDSGIGYYLASSYPIDDVTSPLPSIKIRTEDIPTYNSKSTGAYYDLRDCVDFRPTVDATATIPATSLGSASENPSTDISFSGTPYLPTPDSNFQITLEHYQRRIDRLSIDTNGNLFIDEGLPEDNNPVPPLEKPGKMSLGIITIPPYPSLAADTAIDKKRADYQITCTLSQIRRYTMKDIGALANRIKNLEYYTSLSLLEQKTSSLLVKSSQTGQNRFQNGFWVEPFKGTDIADTNYPNYLCHIDEATSKLIPAHSTINSTMKFDTVLSSGVEQHGELIMLNHTRFNSFISQLFANKYRNIAGGSLYHYNGIIKLTPSGTPGAIDYSRGVDVSQDIDLRSNWVNLGAAGFATAYSDFVNIGSPIRGDIINTSPLPDVTVTNEDGSKTTTSYSRVTYAQTQAQRQVGGATLTVNPTADDKKTFSALQSVGLNPYLKSSTIGIEAHGLKPSTRLYAYFGNVNVLRSVIQTDSDYNSNKKYYNDRANELLVSDSNGSLYALFNIPEGVFRTGDLDFMLVDQPIVVGMDTMQTVARATFIGSNLTASNGSYTLTTRGATVSLSDVTPKDRSVAAPNTFEDLKGETKIIPKEVIPDKPITEHVIEHVVWDRGDVCQCGGAINHYYFTDTNTGAILGDTYFGYGPSTPYTNMINSWVGVGDNFEGSYRDEFGNIRLFSIIIDDSVTEYTEHYEPTSA